jgi:pentapeptide MXKDX repeat protein
MKKLIVATAALTLMCGSAFAQNTGPQSQTDTMQKPGTNNMEKGSMSKGTTGMNNNGMAKDNMKKEGSSSMKKDEMKKDDMKK